MSELERKELQQLKVSYENKLKGVNQELQKHEDIDILEKLTNFVNAVDGKFTKQRHKVGYEYTYYFHAGVRMGNKEASCCWFSFILEDRNTNLITLLTYNPNPLFRTDTYYSHNSWEIRGIPDKIRDHGITCEDWNNALKKKAEEVSKDILKLTAGKR